MKPLGLATAIVAIAVAVLVLALAGGGSEHPVLAEPKCPPSSSSPKCVTPPPPPATSNDVLIAEDVAVGDHEQRWFGAYQPPACADAVIYMGAQGTSADLSPTYDFLVAASDDGLTPRNNQWTNIGNSTLGGTIGIWKTTRKVSLDSTGAWDYFEPSDAPYMLVGVFANQPHRFVVEVHCTRDYPP